MIPDAVLREMDREPEPRTVLFDCRSGVLTDFLRALARPFWGDLIEEGWDRLGSRESAERAALLRQGNAPRGVD